MPNETVIVGLQTFHQTRNGAKISSRIAKRNSVNQGQLCRTECQNGDRQISFSLPTHWFVWEGFWWSFYNPSTDISRALDNHSAINSFLGFCTTISDIRIFFNTDRQTKTYRKKLKMWKLIISQSFHSHFVNLSQSLHNHCFFLWVLVHKYRHACALTLRNHDSISLQSFHRHSPVIADISQSFEGHSVIICPHYQHSIINHFTVIPQAFSTPFAGIAQSLCFFAGPGP